MAVIIEDQSLVTALGAHPDMLRSAVAAGMSGFRHCTLVADSEPVTMAPVPDAVLELPLPAPFPGMSPPHIRLLKIAAFALSELAPRLPAGPLPLFLAGPEHYYAENRVSSTFIHHLVEATGVDLDYRNSRYFAEGRAGGIKALAAAMHRLEQGDLPCVLVGGIDTFHDVRTISALKKQWRLLGDASVGGMVPGEGAGFLVLTRRSEVGRSRAALNPPCFGIEPGHLFGHQPYTAEALAGVVQEAVSEMVAPVATIYSSNNGEYHYQRELTLARLRLKASRVRDYRLCHLAEHVGDLGAASAMVALALAATEPDPTGASVVCASSDSGARAAVVIHPNGSFGHH